MTTPESRHATTSTTATSSPATFTDDASARDGLRLARHDGVAVITLDNPPANTWTERSLDALVHHLETLSADPAVNALVIVGAGDKFFSAGADLKRFANGDKAAAWEMVSRFGRAFEALTAFRGVTIAAINGYAMGGGLECALACDIRIAERQAQMALPEAGVGLLPCAGGTQHLPWVVGEGWAKRVILCGERIDAERALAIGLIEEIVDTGQALDTALALAERSRRQSPQALSHCKRLIMNARDHGLPHGYRMERDLFMALFETDAPREGVDAFLAKRAPDWTRSAPETRDTDASS